MRNVLSEMVFKEPEGRNSGLVHIGIAVVLLGVYAYMGRRYGFSLNPPIILAVVSSLYGVTEMFPTNSETENSRIEKLRNSSQNDSCSGAYGLPSGVGSRSL